MPGDVIVHRVARSSFCGAASSPGCIVNRDSAAAALRLDSGTVAPGVERRVQGACAMSEPAPEARNEVNGERETAAVNPRASVQSRISNLLAIGLMSVLGLGMLTWYYANAMTRQSRARRARKQFVDEAAPGRHARCRAWEGSIRRRADERHRRLPIRGRRSRAPMVHCRCMKFRWSRPAAAPMAHRRRRPRQQLALERQLSGTVFIRRVRCRLPARCRRRLRQGDRRRLRQASPGAGELTALLRPSVTTAVRAQVLPTQRLLAAQGRIHRLHAWKRPSIRPCRE
jgi:hypothetical protein